MNKDCETCNNFKTTSAYKLHQNCKLCDIENNKFLGYTKIPKIPTIPPKNKK